MSMVKFQPLTQERRNIADILAMTCPDNIGRCDRTPRNQSSVGGFVLMCLLDTNVVSELLQGQEQRGGSECRGLGSAVDASQLFVSAIAGLELQLGV